MHAVINRTSAYCLSDSTVVLVSLQFYLSGVDFRLGRDEIKQTTLLLMFIVLKDPDSGSSELTGRHKDVSLL